MMILENSRVELFLSRVFRGFDVLSRLPLVLAAGAGEVWQATAEVARSPRTVAVLKAALSTMISVVQILALVIIWLLSLLVVALGKLRPQEPAPLLITAVIEPALPAEPEPEAGASVPAAETLETGEIGEVGEIDEMELPQLRALAKTLGISTRRKKIETLRSQIKAAQAPAAA